MKNYLVTLSTKYDRKEVIDHFKKNGISKYWYYCLPYSFFMQSDYSAKEIGENLIKTFGEHMFFIVEVNSNNWGVLPKDYWDLIREGFKLK